MAKFIVQGGKPLKGEVKLAGAKNAASKVLMASLLTDEKCVFENFPDIGDTDITFELCEVIGSDYSFDDSTVEIHTPDIKNDEVVGLSRRNRIPILAMGPLLARRGKAKVPILGGDKIGPRPVDIHVNALKALGAEFEITDDFYRAHAPDGLKGANIEFRYPSVGATENTILAAVTADGKTVIKNGAVEPEIMALIKLLQKMGAIIEVSTDRRIFIEGVDRLRGVRHRILPDRNEAVSFACLAVATGGDIFVKDATQNHLITFLNTIRKVGADYEVRKDGIRFWSDGNLEGVEVETNTHPGFMTDWQQPLGVVLTQSEGESIVHETVYEDRFGYVEDLKKMGAEIEVMKDCPDGFSCRFDEEDHYHAALFKGPTKLKGSDLKVLDLRAGMAHLIAALTADGKSSIDGIEEIDRGYERIDKRLRSLGADIKRIE